MQRLSTARPQSVADRVQGVFQGFLHCTAKGGGGVKLDCHLYERVANTGGSAPLPPGPPHTGPSVVAGSESLIVRPGSMLVGTSAPAFLSPCMMCAALTSFQHVTTHPDTRMSCQIVVLFCPSAMCVASPAFSNKLCAGNDPNLNSKFTA